MLNIQIFVVCVKKLLSKTGPGGPHTKFGSSSHKDRPPAGSSTLTIPGSVVFRLLKDIFPHYRTSQLEAKICINTGTGEKTKINEREIRTFWRLKPAGSIFFPPPSLGGGGEGGGPYL